MTIFQVCYLCCLAVKLYLSFLKCFIERRHVYHANGDILMSMSFL